jgi:hypothetical protein
MVSHSFFKKNLAATHMISHSCIQHHCSKHIPVTVSFFYFLWELHNTTQTLTTRTHTHPLWIHVRKPYPYKHLLRTEHWQIWRFSKSPLAPRHLTHSIGKFQNKGVFGRAPALEKQLQSCRSTQFRHGAAPPWIWDPVKYLVQLQISNHAYDI